MKLLRVLERENGRLKELAPERDLEIDAVKDVAAENGERVRSTAAGRVRIDARSLAATNVGASTDGKVGTPLQVEEGGEGRRHCDQGDRGRAAVPSPWLPANPLLLGCDGHGMSNNGAYRQFGEFVLELDAQKAAGSERLGPDAF